MKIDKESWYLIALLQCVGVSTLIWFTIIVSMQYDFKITIDFNYFGEGVIEFFLLAFTSIVGFVGWAFFARRYKKEAKQK